MAAAPHASLAGYNKAAIAALAKLGIHREFDLVLHLPMRYDDETRLYPISEAPEGAPALVEGVVIDNAIKLPAQAPARVHRRRRIGHGGDALS